MSAEGDVALCSADGKADTTLSAEDHHKKVMLKSTVTGEVFLKQATGTMVSLEMLLGRRKDAEATLRIGGSHGSAARRCSALMVPRLGNMKVLGCVVGFHSAVGVRRASKCYGSEWQKSSRNCWGMLCGVSCWEGSSICRCRLTQIGHHRQAAE